jgi:hypothetical protein
MRLSQQELQSYLNDDHRRILKYLDEKVIECTLETHTARICHCYSCPSIVKALPLDEQEGTLTCENDMVLYERLDKLERVRRLHENKRLHSATG